MTRDTKAAYTQSLRLQPYSAAQTPLLRDLYPPARFARRFIDGPIGGSPKRAVDLLIGSCALLALSPLLIGIAALIKLDSPGPILFRQRRVGFRGRVFRIYKFRTMRTMEDGRGLTQAVIDDVRVTRVGAFLRAYSLDELPQLLNVIAGDMSPIGPRPHALAHESEFTRFDPNYSWRHLARPGMTGLAQVSGARGPTDTPERIAKRVRYDLQYVRTWSMWLDLSIILRTVGMLFRKTAF